MYVIHMSFAKSLDGFRRIPLAAIALCCLVAPCRLTVAQAPKDAPPAGDKPAAAEKAAEKNPLPPLPPDAHIPQSMTLDGKTLRYTVTVGSLPVRDKDGKESGDVVFTAYTVEGENRPVTFAFNGGPGASSVYLNFGAIGPKHLRAGNEGDSPSDPATLTDNPGTWLDFTDLVFIDPIGTGFSRSLCPRPKPRSSSTPPRPISNTYPALSTTGWSRTTASPRKSTSSAKATAAFAGRASPITCSRSSA